jgi:hypothetical protein
MQYCPLLYQAHASGSSYSSKPNSMHGTAAGAAAANSKPAAATQLPSCLGGSLTELRRQKKGSRQSTKKADDEAARNRKHGFVFGAEET